MTLTLSPESLRCLPGPEFSRLQTALTPRTTSYIPPEHLAPGRLSTQQHALLCLSHLLPLDEPSEVLYGGSAGGGKTDALLMAALQYADVPGYAALILRRTFKQLALPDAAMARSHDWLRKTDAKWNGDKYTWTFPSGATLTFGHLQHEESKYDYQGAAFQFVGFDELTQFVESQYLYLHSRTRRLEGSPVPIRVWSTSNPGGVGHAWVRAKFIDGPALYIPARMWDNRNIDQDAYQRSMQHLPAALRQQLLDGDWAAFEGMAYLVEDGVHVVPAFVVPGNWQRFEAMDYGSRNPTAWLAFAVDYDGNILVFGCYYSPGLVSEHAEAVKRRRLAWWPPDENGVRETPVCYGPPDIKTRFPILDYKGREISVETEFAEHGISFAAAQTDRRAGYQRVSELLARRAQPFPAWHPRAGGRDAPGLYIFDLPELEPLIRQLRDAPLEDPSSPLSRFPGEAVEADWEGRHGHAHAALRYGLMSRPMASEPPPPWIEDPRRRMLDRIDRQLREEDDQRMLGYLEGSEGMYA